MTTSLLRFGDYLTTVPRGVDIDGIPCDCPCHDFPSARHTLACCRTPQTQPTETAAE